MLFSIINKNLNDISDKPAKKNKYLYNLLINKKLIDYYNVKSDNTNSLV